MLSSDYISMGFQDWNVIVVLTLSLPRVINFKFPLQPQQKFMSHSMESLAFNSLPRCKLVILPILTTSFIHFSLQGWENVIFLKLGGKGLIVFKILLVCLPLADCGSWSNHVWPYDVLSALCDEARLPETIVSRSKPHRSHFPTKKRKQARRFIISSRRTCLGLISQVSGWMVLRLVSQFCMLSLQLWI